LVKRVTEGSPTPPPDALEVWHLLEVGYRAEAKPGHRPDGVGLPWVEAVLITSSI
jgi:hypothetical protein